MTEKEEPSVDTGGSDAAATQENAISGTVVTAAIEVHRTLGGPGLLESVYEEALAFELRNQGLFVERQKPVPLLYKGNLLQAEFRLDLLVVVAPGHRRVQSHRELQPPLPGSGADLPAPARPETGTRHQLW